MKKCAILPPPRKNVNNSNVFSNIKSYFKFFKRSKNPTVEHGRSMTEMLGVLAIVGILSVGSILGYNFGISKYRANVILNGVKTIVVLLDADNRFLFDEKESYSPDELSIETQSNHEYAISSETYETYYVVVKNVPYRVCELLTDTVPEYVEEIIPNAFTTTLCENNDSNNVYFFINNELNSNAQNPDRYDRCDETPCPGVCHDCVQGRCIDNDDKCPDGETCTNGQCSTCEKGYVLLHSPGGTNSICCPKGTNGVKSYWESASYLACCPKGTSSYPRSGNSYVCVVDKCPSDKPNRLTYSYGNNQTPICCPTESTGAATLQANSVTAGGDIMQGYCCKAGYEPVKTANSETICSAVSCPTGQSLAQMYQGYGWKKTCCPSGITYAATKDTVIGHAGCCTENETLVYGNYESTCLPDVCPASAPARVEFIFNGKKFEWCCPAGTKVAAETKGNALWFYNYGGTQPYCCKPNQILAPNPQWNNNRLECQDCPSGTVPNESSSACVPCPDGSIPNGKGNACEACPDGTVPNQDGTACL